MTTHGRAVVVIGGGLAGMAAAARLAKAGLQVDLFEASDRLGGSWASRPLAGTADGVLVDSAPAVLQFPAPVRDLFRKTGRPLEAELGRLGYALIPGPPVGHTFGDGSELVLPTDRGEQYRVLRDAYGAGVSERWRRLLDELDEVWQTVRPLGLEAELRGRSQLTAAVRQRLQPRRSIEHLAREIGHPHLAALLRAVAYRAGSSPRRTPAWCAVELAVTRSFGRWVLQGPDTGRSSVLVEALAGRLVQRKVGVHLDSPVSSVLIRDGRAAGVLVGRERHGAAAVISTVDPWQLYDALLPKAAAPAERRGVHRLVPAQAPAITHSLVQQPCQGVSETVRHPQPGRRSSGPRVEYRRPAGVGTLQSVHDFAQTAPRPAWGAAWRGFGSWLRRPPVTSAVRGLFLAGPFSRGGGSASQTVLSGALASYGGYDYVNGTGQL